MQKKGEKLTQIKAAITDFIGTLTNAQKLQPRSLKNKNCRKQFLPRLRSSHSIPLQQ